MDGGLDLAVISASQSSISAGPNSVTLSSVTPQAHFLFPMPAVKGFENTSETVAKRLGVPKKHVTYLCVGPKICSCGCNSRCLQEAVRVVRAISV